MATTTTPSLKSVVSSSDHGAAPWPSGPDPGHLLESKQSVEGQKKLQELRSMLIPGNRDFFESQKKREEELAASRARQSGGAPQTS